MHFKQLAHTLFAVCQVLVQEALQKQGLMDCAYGSIVIPGLGNGIKLVAMKDPWPEIDLNVAGVDKGKALARFLENTEVLEYLGRRLRDM